MQAIQNFKNYLKILQIIHFALLGGQLLTAGIFAFLVHYQMANINTNFPTNIIYLTLLLPALGVLGSNFLFKTFLQRIDNKADIKRKLSSYQGALIVRYAILQGTTFLLLVVYFLCGNKLLVIAALLGMAYFFMMRPTEIGLIDDLELNQQEKNFISDPNNSVANEYIDQD